MAEYKWDDAKFFEMLGSAWNDEKFNQLGVKNGIATMEREPSREKLARAFMMACGHSFEDTYDQSTEKRMERFAFGKQFTALLETASGSKSEISEQERAQMLADMGRKFLQANPSAQDRLNDRIRTEGVAYFGDRQWAGWLLDEMYYAATAKMLEEPYPNIDFSDLEQVRQYADRVSAYAGLGIDVAQTNRAGMKERMNAAHRDYDQMVEVININNVLGKAIRGLSTSLSDPIRKEELTEALKGRMILDLYGKSLGGLSRKDAAEQHDFLEVMSVNNAAQDFVENAITPYQYPAVKNYIQGKPGSIAPFYMKDGERVKAAAYDKREPKLDIARLPGNITNAAAFDQLFAGFEENPVVHSEPIVNRIYIDGKNAYDLFKGKYQGNAQQIEECVKEDIVRTLMEGKNRVELARMDLDRNGMPKATVVPVKADLSSLDRGKKWYESSIAKKADKLWTSDSKRGERNAAIAKEAEERQRKVLLSRGYQSSFYTSVLNEMNAVRNQYKTPEFLAAEQKLKQDPEQAREWTIQRTAAMYQAAKDSAEILNKSMIDDQEYAKLVRDFTALSDLKMGMHRLNFVDSADGRYFKETVEMIHDICDPSKTIKDIRKDKERAANIPDDLLKLREGFDKTVSRLTDPVKIEETRLDVQDEAVRRVKYRLKLFGQEVTNLLGREEQKQIISMADPERLKALDEQFLGKGGNAAKEYAAFEQIRMCNVKVMEAMTGKMQAEISSKQKPDDFRNDIRSIRSLMETVGISQTDMDAFGRTLKGEQKETFDRIRKWENTLLKGDATTEIRPAEGFASAKDTVNGMLKLYQNAFYDKLGYVNRMDAVSVDRVAKQVRETTKKAVAYEGLVKDEQKAAGKPAAEQNLAVSAKKPSTPGKTLESSAKEKK